MLPDGRRLGAHLALGHGMVRAAERARTIGARTIQVFTDNPTAWRRRETLPRELPAFRQILREADITPLSVHAPYLVNLAGDDPLVTERSCAVLTRELEVGAAYGAAFVNVHIGSHRGAGVQLGVRRVAENVARALAAARPDGPPPRLVLENSSGGGFGLGATVDELAGIDAALAAAGVDPGRVGWCLDAAHAWGAGIDVGTALGVDALVAELDVRLGLDRLVMVHLNDSRSERGSRSDRHEHLGAGRIGIEGLRRILTHPALGHVAYVLETPGMDEGYDAVNLDRARRLAEGL
ncbi:MAG TPA: deoxyribonuclease IV, partial [Candidatus Limnocylindrales bacterium]|nr:deoxyribonuclease IV [Candidatus Limnocylindrales bacterium]